MSAALLAVGVFNQRSRQFTERLSCPPTNHFANGSFHCSTVFQGLNQTSSFFACFAQNFSGERIDWRYSFRYSASDLMCACFENPFEGLNTLFSCITDVIFAVWACCIRMLSVRSAACNSQGFDSRGVFE